MSDAGNRCPARTRLEFDHADPVARGGQATVERMRLRCRAHNQYAAECAFGAGFMERKRREAATARAASAAHAKARTQSADLALAEATAADERAGGHDVAPWLRQLGFRADEIRRASELCESLPDASLEERVRFALRHLSPHHRRVGPSPAVAT